MTLLRWEKESFGSWVAYRRAEKVGHVIPRGDGTVVYEITAARVRYPITGYGEVESIDSGKLALERAWRNWLDAFGLKPINDTDPN